MASSFPAQPSQYNIRISAQNACGSSGLSNAYVVTVKQSGCGSSFAVSPNPANNTVTVQQKEKNNNFIDEVKIFDNVGSLRKQVKFSSATAQTQVNVVNLNAGVYTIEISSGKYKEKQQLLIKK